MSTDERVLALQDKVKAKKAEIEKAERPSWKTNCSFSTSKSKINIQTVSKVEDLIDLTVILLHESTLHAAACKALGVEIKYLKDGFTVDDWMSDFKTRVSKIEILKKKKELAVMEPTNRQYTSSALDEGYFNRMKPRTKYSVRRFVYVL